MNQNLELADVFLRQSHPVESGWAHSTNVQLPQHKADYIFQRNDQYHVVVIKKDETYVSKKAVEEASSLLAALKKMDRKRSVKVILAYGTLLIPPARLPNGIVIVSMSEDLTEQEKEARAKPCVN
jgi:hypothetical protein